MAFAAAAVLLWVLLPPARLQAVLAESGPVETLAALLHLVVAVAVAAQPRFDARRRAALAILFTAFGLRELDWHKAWTGASVLKFDFYFEPNPLGAKLAALAVLVPVAWALVVLARQVPGCLRAAREGAPWAVTAVAFVAAMAATKLLDRSYNVLAEDFGIVLAENARLLIAALEEVVEAGLPLAALVGVVQAGWAAPSALTPAGPPPGSARSPR